MTTAIYIIAAIIMFGLLIAVHEAGHFAAAKSLGIKVNEFAIGMGPVIFKRQKGETLYSLRCLPIGGFCAMEGEDEDSAEPRAFTNARAWKRLIVLVAGSLMNFIIGLLIVLLLFSNAAAFHTGQIAGFMEGFPLKGEDGLLEGDIIRSIDGERIYMYSDLATFLARGNGRDFDLVIIRDGERIELEDFPLTLREYTDNGRTVTKYGLYFSDVEATAGVKLKMSLYNTLDFVRLVRLGLSDLFTGGASVRDLSGPVGIVEVITDVGNASASAVDAAENIAYIAAFIAVNLAVVNILPLPALDGGRIFLLCVTWCIEKLSRRRLNPKYEGYIHAAGMVFFLALMVFVTFNDVFKLITGAGGVG